MSIGEDENLFQGWNEDITPGGTMGQSVDLLQGTLDLLILKTLALETMHGWGIAQRIQQISKDALHVQQGSLYPALHRLEQQGWIQSEWRPSENNRRAKYYSLTRAGGKQLEAETANWERLSAAIRQILQTAQI
jgi:transcriptional regulator